MLHRFRLLLATAVIALAVTSAGAEPPVPIYPLSQVKAGQRAVGKSVFRGTKIQSFDLEIIGVLHKFQGTRSVILAKVLNGPVVERKSGIIGGMSGSPVYIDGKLVGAIALGWTFSKEPITGITPIEEMLKVWQEGTTKAPAVASGGRPVEPVMVDGRPVTRVRVGLPARGKGDPPGVITLAPLGGMVQVSGYNQRAVSRLSKLLAPYGLQVMQGAGGSEEELNPPLVPGAGVGVKLVSGDFDISALGTVTLNDGKRILAFGHPLMQLGAVDLPLTGAYVYDIMPNLQMSNKIMAPTRPVGVVYRDNQAAIAGELGKKADLLPVTMEVTDEDLGKTRKYSLQVVRTKELMPSLVAVSSLTALDEVRGRVTRGTTHVRIELDVAGREPLVREEWAYDDNDAGLTVLPLVLQPLTAFTDNPLGSLRFKSIHIQVEVTKQRRTATIERVRAVKSRVKAGETATLLVTLRPHGEPPVEVPVEIPLPPDLPRGSVRVAVSSGSLEEQARASLGAHRPRAVSLDQLIDRYLERGNASQLVVQVGLSRRGVGLLGEELPELPAGAMAALRATHPTDLRPAARILKLVKPTQWVLLGRQTTTLLVESAMGAAPHGASPPVEQPEEEPGPEAGGEETSAYSLDSVPVTDWMLPLAVENAGDGDEQPKKNEQEKAARPLTKAPDTWVHRSKRDYARAKMQDIAVRSDGRVTLALSDHEVARLDAEVIWCVAVRGGVAYVGTGTEGKIYAVSPDGEVKEFFATGEMNVHDLAFDKQGNLYAATSPHGRLFRITPDGKGEVIYSSGDTYLWCLTMGPGGTIYAGSGVPGRVYAIRPGADGAFTGRLLATLPAANVVSLVRAPSGDLYAGTANAGLVYRIAPDGSVSTVCRLHAASVEALALARDGTLYAAGAPGGDIYRIPSHGLPSAWGKTDQRAVYGLATMEDGSVVAATGSDGRVIAVGPDARPKVIFKPEAGLATAIAESEGKVYVGFTGPCVLQELGPGYAGSGRLESAPLDAGRTARWGRLEWAAAAPEGTAVKAETRSGDSPDPKDHWSDWVPVVDGMIASPPARYLQYRLTLTSENRSVTPEVTSVRVSRLPQNRPPTCTLKSPLPGDRVAKKLKIKWSAKDPDKDRLVYQVSVSDDAGKTWEDLKKDLSSTQYEWDTTNKEDGQYLLRVKATDAHSRPDEPMEAEALAPVVVDNTPPTVMIFDSSVSVTGDGRAHLKGMAADALSPIRSVEYRVGDGPWRSLPLPMIEYSLADFSVSTDPLSAGAHEIEVRAFDAAGNSATDRTEVNVEKAAEEARPEPKSKGSGG